MNERMNQFIYSWSYASMQTKLEMEDDDYMGMCSDVYISCVVHIYIMVMNSALEYSLNLKKQR